MQTGDLGNRRSERRTNELSSLYSVLGVFGTANFPRVEDILFSEIEKLRCADIHLYYMVLKESCVVTVK